MRDLSSLSGKLLSIKLILVLLLLSGCATSHKQRQIVANSCAEILETGHHDIALRTGMINNTRAELGREPYTKGDQLLLYALENDLCEQLILNEKAVDRKLTKRMRVYGQYITLLEAYLADEAFPDKNKKEKISDLQETLFRKGSRYGRDVYEAKCLACHAAGITGAPKTGVRENWQPVMSKGLMSFYDSVINGHAAMPARGLCDDCSDEELKEAVNYMLLSL